MTSRVSFVKLYKETLKHHLASLLVTTFVFIVHLITFFMNFQNLLEYADLDYSYQELMERITGLCSPSLSNGILALLLAAYLAYDYFKYMHSKKETDFYDSLPLRKKDWFKTLLLCCVSVFVILCTLTLGIELAIVFASGHGSFVIFQSMLWNLLCMIGIFLASWVTAALAMIMTGHPVVALMGYGVFSAYVPIILRYLYPAFANTFFDTYVERDGGVFTNFFSPASIAYKMTYHWTRTWEASEHIEYFIVAWIFALVIGVIAYLLFLKRPSEAAGRAMAFEKANSAIRTLLVIPLALYIGLFLRQMSAFAYDAWLIFGVLFGGFIIHGLMECIFQFDARALFSKKKQLLLSLFICCGVVFAFKIDCFNYDEYIPDVDELKTIYITSGNMQHHSAYSDLGEEPDGISGEYVEIALVAAKDIMNFSNSINWDEEIYTDSITFEYELKNGQTKYRRYHYNVNDIPESLDKIVATEEYKNDICSLYTIDRSKLVTMQCYTGIHYTNLDLTEEQKDLLIDTYLEEYTNLTYTQFYDEPVILQFCVEYPNKNENDNAKYYISESEYYLNEYYSVYSSFEKTLALLKEYGAASFHEAENMEMVSLSLYDEKYATNQITDSEKLEMLQNHMYISEFNYNKYDDDWLYGSLRVITEDSEAYLDVCIKKSDVENILE